MDTLPTGLWDVFFTAAITAASSATLAEFFLSGNSNADATSILDPIGNIPAGNTSGATSGGFVFPGSPFTINVTTTQSVYAKAKSYGANRSLTIDGYAIRRA
jgi:BRCT domain type II-containing protein